MARQGERKTANHQIPRIKLSIREKWNCSRSHTRTHTSIVAFMSSIECNDLWNLQTFYRFVCSLYSNDWHAVFFCQTFHHKNNECSIFLFFCQSIDILFDGMTFMRVFHIRNLIRKWSTFWFTCKSNLEYNVTELVLPFPIPFNFDGIFQYLV